MGGGAGNGQPRSRELASLALREAWPVDDKTWVIRRPRQMMLPWIASLGGEAMVTPQELACLTVAAYCLVLTDKAWPMATNGNEIAQSRVRDFGRIGTRILRDVGFSRRARELNAKTVDAGSPRTALERIASEIEAAKRLEDQAQPLDTVEDAE